MTGGSGGEVHASAHGHAQMAVLGQGVQNIYFQNGSRPEAAQRALVAPPEMVGRDREIADLVARLRGDREAGRPVVISALHGMAGIGKTALARAVAAEIKDDFSDAWVEVDLYGHTPGLRPADPETILAELLSWAGYQGADIPAGADARMRLWRGWLSSRRVLLILDNARSADQVRPLLPQHAPGCATLITSRDDLSDLLDADHMRLDTLAPPDAVDLLRRRGGRAVADAVLHEMALLCGHLPLTLEPVGLLLARQSPEFVLRALRGARAQGRERFQHLPDLRQKLHAAFAVSFEALDPDRRETLLWCARHPGPDFDATSIGAMAEAPDYVVAFRLEDLAAKALLSRLPQGRYTFHDLFLECTRARDTDAGAGRQGRTRLVAHLTARVGGAANFLLYGRSAPAGFTRLEAAREWLTAANGELGEALKVARSGRFAAFHGLVRSLVSWLRVNGQYARAEALYREVLDLARGDVPVEAEATAGLAAMASARGDDARAVEFYDRARVLYADIGDRSGLTAALLGLAEVASGRGDYEQAAQRYGQARVLLEETGNRESLAHAVKGLADIASWQGDHAEALARYDEARSIYRETGNRRGLAHVAKGFGDLADSRGDREIADEMNELARSLYEEIGDRHGVASTIRSLADRAFSRREYDRAGDLYDQARVIFEEIGNRRGLAHTLLLLGDTAAYGPGRGSPWGLYERALAEYEAMGHEQGMGYARLAMARLADASGDRESARRDYEAALEHFETSRTWRWATFCRSRIADLGDDAP
ncbi:tetratricopeptide repeat protein [Herbidospora sp. RD11066]